MDGKRVYQDVTKFSDRFVFLILQSRALASKNALWILARVPNPCFIDNRLTRPNSVYLPSSQVQLFCAYFESRSSQDFVRVSVTFCPLGQKREHQFLRFSKA